MVTKENPSSPIVAISTTRLCASCPVGFRWSPIARAILLLIVPVICQGSDLEQLLSGKLFPLAMKLKDLNGEWRRVTLRGNGSITGNVSVNVSGNA